MTFRTVDLNVKVTDKAGNITAIPLTLNERVSVRGGYYLSSGADIRPDTTGIGMNLRSHTTYRSFADANIFPGWQKQWIVDLMNQGVHMNYVLEWKVYGVSTPPTSVNGQPVPQPNATMQQRSGTTWPKYYGWDQVISGACDPFMDRAIAQLNTLPGPVNIQFCSERDTDHEFGITQGGVTKTWAESDALSVQGITYMINYFKTHGAPEGTTFTAGMAGFDQSAFTRCYVPTVDYMQYNFYNHSGDTSALTLASKCYNWITSNLPASAHSKKIIVAEWGCTAGSPRNQTAWIRSVPAAIAQLPKIVVTNYFNSGWGTLNPKADGLQALKDAYNMQPYV